MWAFFNSSLKSIISYTSFFKVCEEIAEISQNIYSCNGGLDLVYSDKDTRVDFTADVTRQNDLVVGHIEDQAFALRSDLETLGFNFSDYDVRIVNGNLSIYLYFN